MIMRYKVTGESSMKMNLRDYRIAQSCSHELSRSR